MSVKRYSVGVDGTDQNGSLVKYEDYAALESRCAEQDEKLRMINELTGAAEQVNKLAQEATERLIQERNALAAENAELNKFIKDDCWIWDDKSEEYFDAADCMPETPATDAFLAEVRAQGADECVRQLVTSDDDDFSDAPNICAMVAHQLRKGVQS